VALTDVDRAGWLHTLAAQLGQLPDGAVLTCSALKQSYRDILRTGAPGLRFLHLAIPIDEALRRVAKREGHFYPPSLVASQFDTLQDPAGEPGVLQVDATAPKPDVDRIALDWLRASAS
jgi:gluconokinase